MRLDKSKYTIGLHRVDQTTTHIKAVVEETYRFAGRNKLHDIFLTHLITFSPETGKGVVFADANTPHPTTFLIADGSICDEHIELENLLDYSTGLVHALPWERQEKIEETLGFLEECVKQLP